MGAVATIIEALKRRNRDERRYILDAVERSFGVQPAPESDAAPCDDTATRVQSGDDRHEITLSLRTIVGGSLTEDELVAKIAKAVREERFGSATLVEGQLSEIAPSPNITVNVTGGSFLCREGAAEIAEIVSRHLTDAARRMAPGSAAAYGRNRNA